MLFRNPLNTYNNLVATHTGILRDFTPVYTDYKLYYILSKKLYLHTATDT